jgi:hypothetical protein
MSKDKISDYSATPGNNTDIGGINIAEGMLPSDVNNAIREQMAQLKKFQSGASGESVTFATVRVVTAINDTNGNELFGVTATGSAVNEFTVANAATGNAPTLSATGGDTNIGMALTPKGTGGVIFPAGAVGTPAITTTGDLNTGIYFPAADTIAFTEGGVEAMRIDSSGNVLVGITTARANAGDVQVSKGISFPATQSAQSDANTLDDYEQGTFTPTAFGQTTAGTTTYTSQVGKYTKIGNVVIATIRLTYNALTGTGNFRIGGLPFASSGESVGTIMVSDLNWSGGSQITPYINNTGTSLSLYGSSDDGAWAQQQCVNEEADFRIQITYHSDD